MISETLSLIRNEKRAEILSRQILEIALKGRLEEKQLVKVAFTLKKFDDNKAVVDFVNNVIRQYPNLTNNPHLLDQKGRALIDLAKKCEATYNAQQNNRIKNKAKSDFEVYINEAQKVLSMAYEYSEDIVDRDYIQKALWYIEHEMKPFLTGKKKENTNERTLFVKYLPKECKEMDIRNIYSKYGPIERITVRRKEGYDTAIAYIVFATKIDAEKAYLDRYNIEFYGRKIHTERYTPK